MQTKAHFTSLLFPLARNWRRAIDLALAPIGMSETLAGPLVYLSRSGGGISQNELAELSGIGGPSLVRVIDRLVTMGLTERRLDENDKRLRRIFLTSAGTALAERIEQALNTARDRVLADVADAEVEGCIAVIERMNRAMALNGGNSRAENAAKP